MSFDLKKFLTENKLTKISQKNLILEHRADLINKVLNLIYKHDIGVPEAGIQIYDNRKFLYDVMKTVEASGRGDEIRFKEITRDMLKTVENLSRGTNLTSLELKELASRIIDLVVDPYHDREFEDRLGREAQASYGKTNAVSENIDLFTDREVVSIAYKAGEYVLDAKEALLDIAVSYSNGVPRRVVERVLDNYDLSLEDIVSDLADEQEYDQEVDQWSDEPYNHVDQKFSSNHFDDLAENKNNFKQNNMSFDLKKFLTENKLTKTSKLVKESITVNGREVDSSSIQVDGVDASDYPDFSDAYIAYAEFIDGTPLNDDELSELGDYAQQLAFDTLLEMQNKNNLKENNMSFDLKKFLTENKLTKSSRLAENDLAFEAEKMQAPVAEEPTAEAADVSRYLNKESADDVIKEIESEVARVALETKINKIKEAIEALDSKANGLEEDANLQGFVNPARLKEMRRMTKKLRMMQERYTKEYDKKYKDGKKKNKEVTNEDAERAFGGTKTVHTAGSILEPVLQQINNARDYLSAKAIVLDAINGSGLAQEMKDKMITDVEGTKTFDRLLKYVYNAYLAKAGLRSPDSGSRMREDISEEEEVQVRTVSRADAGKAIRGTTNKKPMVGANYQGMKDDQIRTVKRPVAIKDIARAKKGLGPQFR